MKVRWKEHEMTAVRILVLWQIIVLLRTSDDSPEALNAYSEAFNAEGLSFIYWRNVMLPQVCSVLLMFAAYLSINLLILPSFRKVFGEFPKRIFYRYIVMTVISMLLVSYLLAIGINIISFYGRPHLFNYKDFQFLSLAGYNDQPLTNLFFGFDRTVIAVIVVTALGGLRDLLIRRIEQPGPRREFNILVTNSATPLLIAYIVLVIILNPVHHDLQVYFLFGTPLPLLYLYLMFWLFPFKREKTFLDNVVVSRLLLATFICSIPGLFIYSEHGWSFIPLLYWMALIFIFTPVCWIIFQQRRDEILQIKNMETALAGSEAKLQLLKSQINPHFLFNALNTLYGTALMGDNEKTAEGIQKLGDMMRFMLHDNTQDFIPVDKEVEYLTNFISLEKLRVQSASDIVIDDTIEIRHANREIAPMLLIPFVENAFKHGVSLNRRSWIKIDLRWRDNLLHYEVRNSIHRKEEDMERGKSGIGLSNVTARLKLVYPDKHKLDITKTKNEFKVKLILQC